MKPITIGILPQHKLRERTLAIARGEFKPKPGDPKVWFTSPESFTRILQHPAATSVQYGPSTTGAGEAFTRP